MAADGASASTLAQQGPVALLLGGALCVSCLASLAFAVAALTGITAVPTSLGLSGVQGLAISGVLLGIFGVLALYKDRTNREAVARGEPPDPYWSFHGPRALASLGLGFVAVAGVALAAKVAVEATTELTYTIHWLETVPFLAVAFAWIIHGEWNRRVLARRFGDGDGPGGADGAGADGDEAANGADGATGGDEPAGEP